MDLNKRKFVFAAAGLGASALFGPLAYMSIREKFFNTGLEKYRERLLTELLSHGVSVALPGKSNMPNVEGVSLEPEESV